MTALYEHSEDRSALETKQSTSSDLHDQTRYRQREGLNRTGACACDEKRDASLVFPHEARGIVTGSDDQDGATSVPENRAKSTHLTVCEENKTLSRCGA